MDHQAAIRVAGRPLLLLSTDSRAQDTLVNQRVNVAAKFRPELTQSVAGRPWGWGWAGHPALEPF
jgi:hypothetical protein